MCENVCTLYERCAQHYIRTNATNSSQFNDKTAKRSLYQFSRATGVELFVSLNISSTSQRIHSVQPKLHVKCVDIVRGSVGCDKKNIEKENII